MTAERNDKAMDEVVSKTYREHSVERAPEHLNRKILSMATAASDAKRGNRLWPETWTIPLAWAATVGLSLAIVLEVTQIPDVRRDVSMPAAESLREEFEPRNTNLLEDAREHAARQSGPNREDLLNTKPRKELKTEVQRKTIEPYAPVAKRPVVPQENPTRQEAAIAEAEAEAEAEKIVARRNAEPEFAKKEKQTPLAGVAPASAPSPVRSFAVLDGTVHSNPGNSCGAASRETAKTWRACIENLSQSGFTEAADREYRALALEFPGESSAFDPKK